MDFEQKVFLEKNNRQILLKQNPSLLGEKTTIEDDELLQRFGIKFPFERPTSPLLIKSIPEDFIVEEIDADGNIHTILDDSDISHSGDNPEGKTIYATLVKRETNTLDAISEIARQLGIQEDSISYSGLKDKDAITSQKIAIRNSDKESVSNVSSENFFLKNIYQDKGVLSPGSLTGNTFTIRLRGDISETDFADIERNSSHIEREGFYNFYYLQRFGVPRLSNFIWAIDILKENYEKAFVDYLTRPTDREFDFVKNIRKNIKPIIGDWDKVLYYLNMFPLTFQTEVKMVEHIIENPNDFKGSFLAVRDQVQLWIYGLASLLFNTVLSEYANEDQQQTPENLPTFLSDKKEDIEIYQKLLSGIGFDKLPIGVLKDFKIGLQHREVNTKSPVIIDYIKKEDFGIEIKFTLPKGSYATTFLSHLVTLKTVANPIKED